MKSLFKYSWIIIIIVLACLLRFWHFPSNPPSLNWDEVSFGYNAYSVLKTGRDEFGNFLPKYFRSLDDYKMPVYSYLTVASVALFGLSDFAVRFPSALFGVLTIFMLYLFVKEACDNRDIALLSAALLAITPWHVQFSRMAAEANVGLFFFVAAITTFLISVRKNIKVLPLSMLCFGLSIYSYRTFEVIAPIMGLVLVVLFWKKLFSRWKTFSVIFSGILILCVGALMMQDVYSSTVNLRVKGTSVFDSIESYDAFFQNSQEHLYDIVHADPFARVLDNNYLVTAGIIAQGYFVHLSPTFWFFDYDLALHDTPFVGLLYLWMVIFIPIGAYYVVKKWLKKSSAILIIWFFISPIPASITKDVPSPIRVLPIVIPIIILVATGMYEVYMKLSKKRFFQYLYAVIMFFCVIFSSVHYFHHSDVHLPIERSQDWVYGRKQLVEYVESIKFNYKQVVVSTSLQWPHIFFLYYSHYDPAKYLAQGGTVSGGFDAQSNHYDTYQFRKFNPSKDFLAPVKNSTLFVGLPDDFPGNVVPLKVIRYLNGKPAILVVDGKRL